jgi:hypothetical protein
MLVGRVHEVHQEALDSVRRHHGKWCGVAGGSGIPGAPTMGWLENNELKLATLELICCDLGLYKRGTKEDLRLRIFEHGQELAGEYEAGCSESRSTALGAEEDACESSENMRSECMTLEALRKDTLRLVCYDLDLAFSGPKHVLIPRILRKCEADRLVSGTGTGDYLNVLCKLKGELLSAVCVCVCVCVCVDPLALGCSGLVYITDGGGVFFFRCR